MTDPAITGADARDLALAALRADQCGVVEEVLEEFGVSWEQIAFTARGAARRGLDSIDAEVDGALDVRMPDQVAALIFSIAVGSHVAGQLDGLFGAWAALRAAA